MSGSFDHGLVTLSVIVAIAASYTALQLAGHVSRKHGRSSVAWLAGGAVAMGTGIWSMHFVGMLAFHLPVPIAYDPTLTLLSLAIAVVVSGIALALVRNPLLSPSSLVFGAIAMGFGISAMHYTGMHAMQMYPAIQYRPTLFVLSIVIAVVASMAALWMAFRLRDKQFGVAVLAKAGSAIAMGLAITGMHYTAMAAADFLPGSICLAVDSTGGMRPATLAGVIAFATMLILSIALCVAAMDARAIREKKRVADEMLHFGAAMDATADAIYLIDRRSMRFLHANAAACRLFARSCDDLLSSDPATVLEVLPEQLLHVFDALIARGPHMDTRTSETIERTDDIPPRWLEVRRHAQRVDDRWTIVSLVRDVTERKAADEWIVHLNRVYAMLSAVKSLIVRVNNRDELFREACRIAVNEGGFPAAWIGAIDGTPKRWTSVASAGMSTQFLAGIGEGFAGDGRNHIGISPMMTAVDQRNVVIVDDIRRDAQSTLCTCYQAAGIDSAALLPLIVDGQVAGIFAIYGRQSGYFKEQEIKLLTDLASDVAFAIGHIGKQDRLDYLAYYDVLTGLANRTLFLERVGQAIRTASGKDQRLALLVIDLEGFKNLNDTVGRATGDTLLRQTGSLLTRMAGDPGLVSRVGPDHFGIFMPDIHDDSGLSRLLDRKVSQFVTHRFDLGGTAFHVAVKVGAAVYPQNGTTAESLFRNAEAALKHAKKRGERYLLYDESMTESSTSRLLLENRLRQALGRGQFVLHYQPKFSLVTDRLTGVEALIRWNDPQHGLLRPADFIPVLEECGLIHDVGRWALRQALDDSRRWCQKGVERITIAVNVSAVQLRQRDFVAEMRKAMVGWSPSAPQLELEITESAVMSDIERSRDILESLRDIGIRIAIDDFGTGFSSLSYLSRLSSDTLKIDRSFVAEVTRAQGRALVNSIIEMAHALSMEVVAEGVETQEQLTALRELGCDEMQGFLRSEPLPRDRLEALFLSLARTGTRGGTTRTSHEEASAVERARSRYH